LNKQEKADFAPNVQKNCHMNTIITVNLASLVAQTATLNDLTVIMVQAT
jgi:hypothetical protein